MTYCDANGVPDRGQLRPARSWLFIMAAKKAVLKAAGVVAPAAEGAGHTWHGGGGGGRGRGKGVAGSGVAEEASGYEDEQV